MQGLLRGGACSTALDRRRDAPLSLSRGVAREREVDPDLVTSKLEVLQFLGDPYTDDQIAAAAAAVEGKTELDAVVAYLQGLGTNRGSRR